MDIHNILNEFDDFKKNIDNNIDVNNIDVNNIDVNNIETLSINNNNNNKDVNNIQTLSTNNISQNIFNKYKLDNNIIIINSKNRNNIRYPLSNNFKINCNLQNVLSISIISHNININQSFLFNEYNNKVLINNNSYLILNYQNKFNINEFQYKLRKITKGQENCFIDPHTNKFNIFDCSIGLSLKFQEYNSTSLASILGFNYDIEYKENNGKIYGTHSVNFNKDTSALLYLNNYKNIDIINFNCKYNFFHLISNNNFYKEKKFNKPININEFSIKICDINGNLLNLNNYEYYIELLIKQF
jgi:hypothetical protein